MTLWSWRESSYNRRSEHAIASPLTSKGAFFALAGASFFFLCAGRAFIPHLGIQTDEALFIGGIYQARAAYFTAFHHSVPLMLDSYIGTLKSLVYTLVFQFFTPTASSTRTPVLLMGVATIWLFFLLLGRLSGNAAAIAGCLLLATDSIFLLTTVFDWGPVALQHLLLVTALLLLYRYYESRKLLALAGGFLVLGLAMWDKAIFVWSLSALAVAAIVVFPRAGWRLLTWRTAGVASLGFLIGASPLLYCNIVRHGVTFRSNLERSHESPLRKLPMVLYTLRGDGLFSWMIREDDDAGAAPLEPRTALARASDWISNALGHPRRNLMLAALLGALLLAPLLWRAGARAPRTMLFAAIFCTVAWLEMASNEGTGGAVHHVVLLWPFPQLFVAVAFGEAAQKFGWPGKATLAILLVFAIPANLLVTNEYYRKMLRNGGGLSWSDAILPLADFLRGVGATQVLLVDWGTFDNLRLLDRGRLPLRIAGDPLYKAALDEHDREIVRQWLVTPGSVFVSHSDECQILPGVNQRLAGIAAASGFARETMAVVRDRNGRPIFQVFRLQPSP